MSDIEGISEGRRKVALEKAEEARREWLRAERAEAEVVTLRAENKKLRAALKKIAKVTYGSDWTWGSEELADYYSMRFFNAQETARAALGEEKKG